MVAPIITSVTKALSELFSKPKDIKNTKEQYIGILTSNFNI